MKTNVEISPTKRIELTSDGWIFNMYGSRAATITNPEGKRIVSYFGFDDQAKANEFKIWIDKNSYCERCIIRKSERLICNIEVKVWKCPMWLVEDCFHQQGNKLQTTN